MNNNIKLTWTNLILCMVLFFVLAKISVSLNKQYEIYQHEKFMEDYYNSPEYIKMYEDYEIQRKTADSLNKIQIVEIKKRWRNLK